MVQRILRTKKMHRLRCIGWGDRLQCDHAGLVLRSSRHNAGQDSRPSTCRETLPCPHGKSPSCTRSFNGGPTWVRTRDRPVMSRWLFQLSYGPSIFSIEQLPETSSGALRFQPERFRPPAFPCLKDTTHKKNRTFAIPISGPCQYLISPRVSGVCAARDSSVFAGRELQQPSPVHDSFRVVPSSHHWNSPSSH